jgi:hypothetical protein
MTNWLLIGGIHVLQTYLVNIQIVFYNCIRNSYCQFVLYIIYTVYGPDTSCTIKILNRSHWKMLVLSWTSPFIAIFKCYLAQMHCETYRHITQVQQLPKSRSDREVKVCVWGLFSYHLLMDYTGIMISICSCAPGYFCQDVYNIFRVIAHDLVKICNFQLVSHVTQKVLGPESWNFTEM